MSESSQFESSSPRLSKITTLWTQLLRAHGDAEFGDCRQSLLMQYRPAIRRYLIGAVRDEDVADELLSEFSVRFLRGDFHRANQDRGRFRDYVRTVLINLVNDYHRERDKSPRQLSPDCADPVVAAQSIEADFDACLRDELMQQSWNTLKVNNTNYHDVLKLKVAEPGLTSREIAEQLAAGGIDMTAAMIRKTVERARKKFAQVFFDHVLDMIEFDSLTQLRTELKRLNLLAYCESEIQARLND